MQRRDYPSAQIAQARLARSVQQKTIPILDHKRFIEPRMRPGGLSERRDGARDGRDGDVVEQYRAAGGATAGMLIRCRW